MTSNNQLQNRWHGVLKLDRDRNDNWPELHALTIGYLSDALSSENNFDLIIANTLHPILPQLKLIGGIKTGGEDTVVHDVLAPLLDITFTLNTELDHFWANITLDNEHKEYKPDYAASANGLSIFISCMVIS
ncbi:hypothetical protein LRAMOSA07200 [Lichtheimia ramosa]|uniref:Uncharacterized protein n=1 Tax=Lichtheimia ramosa TaxID=688394 RepID=A0A077WBZ3_9FUNG|nr:hypothetical protein LRAMOSA07200 [Lichtheimia ramosa]